MNDALRSDPEEHSVERRVMDLAERESVRHHRIASRIAVRDDVRGIEQRLPPQAAERAAAPVGAEHSVPKDPLVNPRQHRAGRVAALEFPVTCSGHRTPFPVGRPLIHSKISVIHGHGEGQGRRVVRNDEGRPDRQVATLPDPVKVEERPLFLHQPSQPHVVCMAGIGLEIPIVEELCFRIEGVPVGVFRRCPDRDRHVHLPWFPDAPLIHQRDPLVPEPESTRKQAPFEFRPVPVRLLAEPIPGRDPDRVVVETGREHLQETRASCLPCRPDRTKRMRREERSGGSPETAPGARVRFLPIHGSAVRGLRPRCRPGGRRSQPV